MDPNGADTSINELPGYIRGSDGNKLAGKRFVDDNLITRHIGGMMHPTWVAQALNFADAIGGVATVESGPDKGTSSMSFMTARQIKVTIPKSSEFVKEVVSLLQNTHNINIEESLLKQLVVDQIFIFESGKDYSSLFWDKAIKIQLARGIGIGISVSMPVAIPILGEGSMANSKNADIVINLNALASEVAETLAPLLQFAEHKKNARPSTEQKHQKGAARAKQDREGSKGEKKQPRKKPKDWKGPWPTKKK